MLKDIFKRKKQLKEENIQLRAENSCFRKQLMAAYDRGFIQKQKIIDYINKNKISCKGNNTDAILTTINNKLDVISVDGLLQLLDKEYN